MHPIPAATVAGQIESVVTDIGLDAVNTGMLTNASIIEAIVTACDRFGSAGTDLYLWWLARSLRRPAATNCCPMRCSRRSVRGSLHAPA